MKSHWLKKSRVILSLVFLLFFALLFLDFSGKISPIVYDVATFTQFIPSLLTFKNLLSLVGIGFLLFIGINLLWGRIYCSTVCPLGIFQDVVSRISRWTSRRKKIFRFAKAFNILRYSILSIAILLLLFGNILLLNLLDPYSNFGKIFTLLGKPVVVAINNGLENMLSSLHLYWLNPVDLREVNPFALIYPSIFLVLVVWLSWIKGRLFCNTLCPVGGFLSLLSRASLNKIKVTESSCDRCGKCSVVCKAQCIDVKVKKVDFSRCVACFNCISACPSQSIHYKFGKKEMVYSPPETDSSKREFFAKAIAFALGMGGLSRVVKAEIHVVPTKASTIPEKKKYAVSPPGSLSLDHFTSNCTACQLCVSACPSHVLKPSLFEYSVLGIMQPHMDYHASYCNYECVVCTEVCPTGAILPLSVERKKLTQTGKVIFEKENCIVYTENTACGACNEHCPTQAVKMVPYKGNLTIPETDQSICIGCGACEHACPTRPYRAIYVDGNSLHQVAEKPKEEKIEETVQQDFPF